MSYEINISKKTINHSGIGYNHFFATAERSINDSNKLKEVYAELSKAFPMPEYKISIWEKPHLQYGVDPETFLSENQ